MAVYHGVRMNKDQATSGRPPNVQGTLRSNLIAICAPEEIKTVFHSYSKEIDSRNGSWAQCFEIHLLILHELLGTWRPYLRWLTLEIASSVCCYHPSHLLFLTFSRLKMPFLLALGWQAETLMRENRARSWNVARTVSNIVGLVLSVCSTLLSPLLEVTNVMLETAWKTGILWMMRSSKHSKKRFGFWLW